MSAISKEYENEFTPHDVQVTRDGDWYFVHLAGRRLDRRYSRSGAITGVRVNFATHRSPRYPKTFDHLIRHREVDWLTGDTQYVAGPAHTFDSGNYLEAPLKEATNA